MGILKRKKLIAVAALTLTAMLLFTTVSFADEVTAGTDNPVNETESDKVTVMLTGDLMCQRIQQLRAFDGTSYNFKPTF